MKRDLIFVCGLIALASVARADCVTTTQTCTDSNGAVTQTRVIMQCSGTDEAGSVRCVDSQGLPVPCSINCPAGSTVNPPAKPLSGCTVTNQTCVDQKGAVTQIKTTTTCGDGSVTANCTDAKGSPTVCYVDCPPDSSVR